MSDLSQGQRASLVLNPGQVYRISTSGVLTVTPAYGAPAGTVTLTAQTQDFGPYDAPAKLELNAVSGTGSYSIKGFEGSIATVDPVGGQLTAAGRMLPTNAGASRLRLLSLSDSIPGYGGAFAENMLFGTGNLPYGNGAVYIVAASWANAGGSGTLTFSKASQTLRWQAPGDVAGPPVDVSKGGVYPLPSGSATKTLTVVCHPRRYAASTEGAYTVTTTANSEYGRMPNQSLMAHVRAKCNNAFDLDYLTNDGGDIDDLIECATNQVQAGVYDGIVVMVGINAVTNGQALAQMLDGYQRLRPVLASKAPAIFFCSMLPRSAAMTTTQKQIIAACNKHIVTTRYPGYHPVNLWNRIVDLSNVDGNPLPNMMQVDGTHTNILSADAASDPVVTALTRYYQFEVASVITSQANTYDATSNPYGNQLPSGGTWAGTGGNVSGAGMSGQLAPGWRVERNTPSGQLTCVCSKVARTDGIPGENQRLVIANPNSISEQLLLSLSARPAIAAGQKWQLQAANVINASAGLEFIRFSMEQMSSGRFSSAVGDGFMAGAALSGARAKQTSATWPVVVQAGADGTMNILGLIQLAAGGSLNIEFVGGEWELARVP